MTREVSPEITALRDMARRQLHADQLQRVFAQRAVEATLGRESTPGRKACRAKQKARCTSQEAEEEKPVSVDTSTPSVAFAQPQAYRDTLCDRLSDWRGGSGTPWRVMACGWQS